MQLYKRKLSSFFRTFRQKLTLRGGGTLVSSRGYMQNKKRFQTFVANVLSAFLHVTTENG